MGLEGFVDWVDPISRDSAEGREDDMSNFAIGFVAWMCPQAKGSQQASAGFTTSFKTLCEP